MVSLLERKDVGSELSRDVRIVGIWSKAIGILFLWEFQPIHMRSNQIRTLVPSVEKDLESRHIMDK